MLFQSMVHTAQVNPYRHAHEFVDLSHFLAIPLCQIVIDRNHVNTFGHQRVQIYRKCSYQRFTFTRFHLGNTAFM
ncbi:hypothetical protein D3C74_307850 [compost metagenome]